MQWLNYRHFMYFKVIAEEGSIVKASLKLLVGQPALSSQLKQLEESLGHPLFRREKRSLVLTAAGRQALGYAQEIDKLGMEFLDSMRDQNFAEKVKFQIGSLDSIPKRLIARIVRDLKKIAPNIEVKLLEGDPDKLLRLMDSFQIDLIVANYPGMIDDLDRSYYSKSIGKYPVNIYGTKKYSKLKVNFPESLEGAPLVVPTSASKLRDDLEHYFHLKSIKPSIIAETQDTSLQKTLGAEGVGLVPISEYSGKTLHANNTLQKIGALKNVYEEYWIVAPKKFKDHPLTNELFSKFKL